MDFASWDDESLRRAIRAGFTTRSDELAAEREALKRWVGVDEDSIEQRIDASYDQGYIAGKEDAELESDE